MNDSSNNGGNNNEQEETLLEPPQQLEMIWNHILQHNSTVCQKEGRTWPHYKDIMDDVTNTDYSQVLTCPHDVTKNSRTNHNDKEMTKTFCAHGVVSKVKIEMFQGKDNTYNTSGGKINNYSGLLRPGQTVEHCIIRMSNAMKPPASESNMFGRFFLKAAGGKLKNAKIFPMVAIKALRGKGVRSGNLLFAGTKIGQKTDNFFEQSVCTQMTERVPRLLQPFIQKFYTYSSHPLSLGISDFCTFDQNGDGLNANEAEFPYVIVLKPIYKMQELEQSDSNTSRGIKKKRGTLKRFDSFLEDLLKIPIGSVLFDIYACPDPSSTLHPGMIQRIGRISTTSKMIPSRPNDGLFFRHQKKEEDFDLRPSWRDEVKAMCISKDGMVEGTVGTLVGAEFLEDSINQNKFVDFERV